MAMIEVHLEKRINNTTVVRETDVRQQREYLLVTLLGGLFVLGLLFYGWQHYRWMQYGYSIEEAQGKRETLDEMKERLTVEREILRNRARIDGIARRDLRMVTPAAGQWITFRPDAPWTIPVPEEGSQPELSAKK